MGIWIRSQNKMSLNKVNDIEIFENETKGIEKFRIRNENCFDELGVYSSKEKAIKVLDMIQEEICNNYEPVQINERTGTYRLKIGVDKVFKMPQDNEVE